MSYLYQPLVLSILDVLKNFLLISTTNVQYHICEMSTSMYYAYYVIKYHRCNTQCPTIHATYVQYH